MVRAFSDSPPGGEYALPTSASMAHQNRFCSLAKCGPPKRTRQVSLAPPPENAQQQPDAGRNHHRLDRLLADVIFQVLLQLHRFLPALLVVLLGLLAALLVVLIGRVLELIDLL